MSREGVSILLTSKPDYNEFALKYFLLSLNKVQKYYEFTFPDIHNCCYTNEYYDLDTLFRLFETECLPKIRFEDRSDYLVNIITSSMEENLFFECRKNVAFITTHNWERYFSPPSLFEYLSHCIVGCLLFMNDTVDLHSHRHTTKGCCLDYTHFKMNDRVGIALGYVCDECKERIINGMNRPYLADIIRIINREWIGNINDFGSVAYNLKNFFEFDINKDSGFNKTFWEKTKGHFHEIPPKIIVGSIGLIMGFIFGHYVGK